MPQYSYQCIEEDGGCGHTFSIFLMMSDYNSDISPSCPLCNTFQFVKRDFEADLPRGRVDTQTLGSLAEKNMSSMSKDERENRWYENNKYRFEGETPGLPKDMVRMRNRDNFDIRGTNRFKKKRSPEKRK